MPPRPLRFGFLDLRYKKNGGAMENRTPDLRIANATLYQLSYDPTKVGFCLARRATGFKFEVISLA